MKKHFSRIAALPLFDHISKENLHAMLECMGAKVRKYQKGEIVLLSEEQVRYVGVILEGRIHMVKELSDGEEILLAIIRKKELFGESFACLENPTSYATFVTADDTTVLFLPFSKVMHQCDNRCPFHHRMIENMVSTLSVKNVRLMQKIDISSRKTLREKILSYLKLEQEVQGTPYVELDINKTTLAAYLCVNRSALARELTEMQENGILEYQGNRYYLTTKTQDDR